MFSCIFASHFLFFFLSLLPVREKMRKSRRVLTLNATNIIRKLSWRYDFLHFNSYFGSYLFRLCSSFHSFRLFFNLRRNFVSPFSFCSINASVKCHCESYLFNTSISIMFVYHCVGVCLCDTTKHNVLMSNEFDNRRPYHR